MRVRWLHVALANVDAIAEYIARDNPEAAQYTVQAFFDAVDALAADPNLDTSRPGRVSGTRELIVATNYLIPYRIRGETLEVLRVMHGRQRWPDRFP